MERVLTVKSKVDFFITGLEYRMQVAIGSQAFLWL